MDCIFYIELTHLAQKFKKITLNETSGAKLNSNWILIVTLN